jgi:hypothetical protein
MMRKLIAALVAGFLLMLWQTLSHTALNLHAAQEQYTPRHAVILQMLTDSLGTEGMYYLPGVPPGTTMEEMEQMQTAMAGKPWAQINYHTSLDVDMTGNILRGLGVNIVIALVLVWLLGQVRNLSFGTALLASLAVGFMAFSFHPYPGYIWYKTPGISMDLLDSLAAFGLAGIWLGWYLPRGVKR